MVAQALSSFMTPEFVRRTKIELEKTGFVSDEHEFAPYRETLSEHVEEIEQALHEVGFRGTLLSGFIKHSEAGYAYFIYDQSRFGNPDEANAAVSHWLDIKYGPEH